MKKKLILLSSLLFALGIAGCKQNKIDDNSNIIDDGNGTTNPSGNGSEQGNGNENGNGEDNGNGETLPVEDRKPLSDYADEDGGLSDSGFRRLIKDSYDFCVYEEEEGSVLLFNKEVNGRKALPLAANERNVSLFGAGTRRMFLRSGSGGAAPNTNLVLDLEKSFEAKGFNINKTILDLYDTGYVTDPNQNYEPLPVIYTDEEKATFANYNDAAIITLTRAGTEDKDIQYGRLKLSGNEEEMIRRVVDTHQFNKLILLINSAVPMSMDWVVADKYGIDAAIWMGVPGYYGCPGVVNLLMGKDGNGNPLSPSGHLTQTFPVSVDSAPSNVNFGNSKIAVYKEGIYVGYKYYETRYEDLVLGRGNADCSKGVSDRSGVTWKYEDEVAFPFGYGETYTTFDSRITGVNYNRETDQYEVEIEVKNTGTRDAKYTGQVYAQQPYTDFDRTNGIEKSAIALMGYEKVDVKAGQTVTFTVNIDKYFLATYDNVVNKTYILEAGDYYFAIGNGAHEALNNILALKAPGATLVDHNGDVVTGDANCAKKVVMREDFSTYSKSRYNPSVKVSNRFDDADYNYYAEKNGKEKITYLSRNDWNATWPTTTEDSPAISDDKDMARLYSSADTNKGYSAANGVEYNVPAVIKGKETVISFAEMTVVPLEGKVTDKNSRFVGMEGADVWDMFIKQMTLDELAISISDNRGILSVSKITKPGNSFSEGSEGLLGKFQYGDKRWATGFPTGPICASTWNHEMQQKHGSFFAEEAIFCGVPCLNGPGATIIRSPYTSRASEFMSEDSILTYNCIGNIVGEARKKGLIMNVKHALLNNQESGRRGLETYCNEQAIREIYLRAFEGAVVKGNALGVITSYNRIGTTYSACHNNLMDEVMRGEWNYKGLFMCDSYSGNNSNTYSNGPAMIHNGTNLFMLDGQRGTQLVEYVRNFDDLQILKDMQNANRYILYAISRSSLGYSMNPTDLVDNSSHTTPVNPNPNTNQNGLITDEIKTIANNYEYDFDPASVKVTKDDVMDVNGQFDFSEVSSLDVRANREGHNIVYKFEGSYSEGWQGDYTQVYGYLYLWEDGKLTGYFGNPNKIPLRGYWYNVDEDGKDTLVIALPESDGGNAIGVKTSGFYQYETYMYIDMGKIWGQSSVGRSIRMNGYRYYPEVALAIDTKGTNTETLTVGSTLDIGGWEVQRVLKNLSYSTCFEDDNNKISWQVNGAALNGTTIQLNNAGTYTITASWGGLTATAVLVIQ